MVTKSSLAKLLEDSQILTGQFAAEQCSLKQLQK
jgi:hypothetical protein